VYASCGGTGGTLLWVDRRGVEESLGAPRLPYAYPRLSPDGTRIALDVGLPDRDIWIWDLRRKVLERFTLDPAENPLVAWSLDGKRLAFGSSRYGGIPNLFWQPADGSGPPERLLESPSMQMPLTFTPDGRLLFSAAEPGEGRNILALSLDGTHRVERIIRSPANDGNAEISPDGRWIAYDSNESGQFEIYVKPYPPCASDQRWKISIDGGRQPLWSRNGRELFYRDFTGAVLAVPVTFTPTYTPGAVAKLLDGAAYVGGGPKLSSRTYDLSHDGTRFLMIKAGRTDARPPSLVVVQHWFEELKRLVPAQ
jgi:eukaryotic-like serine/threonine-protein kinase